MLQTSFFQDVKLLLNMATGTGSFPRQEDDVVVASIPMRCSELLAPKCLHTYPMTENCRAMQSPAAGQSFDRVRRACKVTLCTNGRKRAQVDSLAHAHIVCSLIMLAACSQALMDQKHKRHTYVPLGAAMVLSALLCVLTGT